MYLRDPVGETYLSHRGSVVSGEGGCKLAPNWAAFYILTDHRISAL